MPVPTALTAATVKTYSVPFVSPDTVCAVAGDSNRTGGSATPPM